MGYSELLGVEPDIEAEVERRLGQQDDDTTMQNALSMAAEDDDVRRCIRIAIGRLPVALREILSALYYAQETVSDIAERTGLSRTTIYRRRDMGLKVIDPGVRPFVQARVARRYGAAALDPIPVPDSWTPNVPTAHVPAPEQAEHPSDAQPMLPPPPAPLGAAGISLELPDGTKIQGLAIDHVERILRLHRQRDPQRLDHATTETGGASHATTQ